MIALGRKTHWTCAEFAHFYSLLKDKVCYCKILSTDHINKIIFVDIFIKSPTTGECESVSHSMVRDGMALPISITENCTGTYPFILPTFAEMEEGSSC